MDFLQLALELLHIGGVPPDHLLVLVLHVRGVGDDLEDPLHVREDGVLASVVDLRQLKQTVKQQLCPLAPLRERDLVVSP